MLSAMQVSEHPGGLCNHLSTFLANFPCNSESSLEQLVATDRIIKKFEVDLYPVANLYYLWAVTKCPIALPRELFAAMYERAPSVVMSNYPTSRTREFVDGNEIIDVFATASCTLAPGLLISSWGVQNQLRFCFTVSDTCFDHPFVPGSLSTAFCQELNSLYAFVHSENFSK
jgi:hypothetical protein